MLCKRCMRERCFIKARAEWWPWCGGSRPTDKSEFWDDRLQALPWLASLLHFRHLILDFFCIHAIEIVLSCVLVPLFVSGGYDKLKVFHPSPRISWLQNSSRFCWQNWPVQLTQVSCCQPFTMHDWCCALGLKIVGWWMALACTCHDLIKSRSPCNDSLILILCIMVPPNATNANFARGKIFDSHKPSTGHRQMPSNFCLHDMLQDFLIL